LWKRLERWFWSLMLLSPLILILGVAFWVVLVNALSLPGGGR
jgi:hypothetical protein